MKVIIWEDAAQETVGKLQQLGADFEFEVVDNESSLINQLDSQDQMCVVLLDIDQMDDKGLALNKQIEQMGLHKRLLSSATSTAKELKSLQSKGLNPDAFLKRPHNYQLLLQTLDSMKVELMQDSPADMSKGGTAELEIDPTVVTQIDTQADVELPDLPGESDGLELGGYDSTDSFDDEDNEPTKILDMDNISADSSSVVGNDDIDIEFGVGADLDSDVELTETEIGLFPNDEQQALAGQPSEQGIDINEVSGESDEIEFDLPNTQQTSSESSLSELDLLNEEKDDFDAQSADDHGSIEVVTSQQTTKFDIEAEQEEDISDGTQQTVVDTEFNLSGDDIEFETSVTEPQEIDENAHEAATTTMMVDSNKLDAGELRAANEDEQTLAQDMGDDDGDTSATVIQSNVLSEFRPGSIEDDKTLYSEDINSSYEDNATIVQSVNSHVYVADMKRDHEAISQHHSDELLRLKVTIENLREDREHLVAKLTEAEKINNEMRFKMNSFQSELDEAKIELGFLKKRYDKDIEEAKYALELSKQKKVILEEKNKEMEKELELANQKIKFDYKKVKEREQQLEGQLELLKADSENLLRNRDNKILELKRSIDALEFDVESSNERERKAKHDKHVVEDKLERIMSTLRRTIGSLDEDLLAESSSDEEKKLKEV